MMAVFIHALTDKLWQFTTWCLLTTCLLTATSFTCSAAVAQTEPTLSHPPQSTHSIQQQINDQRLRLLQLSHLLDDTTLTTEAGTLLTQVTDAITTSKSLSNSDLAGKTVAQTTLGTLRQDLDNTIAALTAHLAKSKQAQHDTDDINEALQGLQQLIENPLNKDKITAQDRADIPALVEQTTSLTQSIDKAISQQQNLSEQLVSSKKQLDDYLHTLHTQPQTVAKPHEQKIITATLQQQVADYKAATLKLQNQLNEKTSPLSLTEAQALQENIYRSQTQTWLAETDITLAKTLNHVTHYAVLPDNLPTPQLEQQLAATHTAITTLQTLRQSVQTRYTAFKQHMDISGEDTALNTAFEQRIKSIDYQLLTLNNQPQQLTQAITRQKQATLFSHDNLYHDGNLATAFSQFSETFVLIGYQIKISFNTLWQGVLKKPMTLGGVAVIYVLLAYLALLSARRWLAKSSLRKGIELGIIATLRKLLHIIRKHFYWFALLTALITLVELSDISSPSDAIISTLLYGITMIFLWLELTAIEVKLNTVPRGDARRSNIAGVLLIVCVVVYRLAVLSSADLPTVQLLEKALMLAMFGFTVVLKNNIHRYLQVEKSHLNQRIYRLYHWLIKVLPHVVMLACGLGLIGYGDLAWLTLRYVGMGALYLITIAVGLIVISVLRKKAKLYSLKRFSHGAFIAQDIVSPLAGIAKILWLWASTAMLFAVAHWNSNSYVIANVLSALKYPLFSFSDNSINALSLLLMLLAIYLIFRVAKWVKTFSYHWLYAKINDLGVRNSLSIFSQYVIALAGILMALKVLGIDLTSLAVFAGALGVGVGLGLQDIAKNFISGILLLIERPLRSGDWVAIDGSEGTVKSIGMRAITIETFDNQEVIIPNGNAIGNSFTNYTHSNSLIRTVLYVGAGYDCDPETVMSLLGDILNRTDGVLADPRPQVVMWEYADSSINYRIQYYIDMDNSGLWATKTAILKAIWYDFKAHNIEIPFPQRDINFRNLLALEKENLETENNALS